jgi:hypothetical protein
MKLSTLIQAGALVLMAVYGAYAQSHTVPPCARADAAPGLTACEL